MSTDAQTHALRTLEAGLKLYEAVDATVDHLEGHPKSVALMLRGDARHLLERLVYLGQVAGVPKQAVATAIEMNTP